MIKVTAIVHSTEYRGDHAAETKRVIDVGPDEKVASLVRRGLTDITMQTKEGEILQRRLRFLDSIELKIVDENAGELLNMKEEST